MKIQNRAYLFALGAIFCWSTIATAFKLGLKFLDAYQLLFLAALVSTLFYFLMLIFTRKVKTVFSGIKVKGVVSSAFLGFLNPFLYYIVLLNAYNMITAQEAMTLNYIWPLVLVLLSIPLLKQKIGVWSMVAMLISFCGIIVIATHGDIIGFRFSNLTGDLLAIGSSVAWALYWIFNLKDKRETNGKMFFNFLFGTLYSAIAVCLWSDFQGFTANGLLAGIYLGVFEMGLTFLLWLTALRLSSKTYLVSQLVFISPFLGFIWIWLVLGENILWSTLVGFVMLISGILIQQKFERSNR